MVLVLVLVLVGLALPARSAPSVAACHEFKFNWTNLFREYVSVPEDTYETLYREWDAFCLHFAREQNATVPSPGDVRTAWANFSSFLPLSSCDLRKTGESRPPHANDTGTYVPADGLRVCIEVAELVAIILLVAFLAARQLCARYVQCTQEVHGFDVPDSSHYNHRRTE